MFNKEDVLASSALGVVQQQAWLNNITQYMQGGVILGKDDNVSWEAFQASLQNAPMFEHTNVICALDPLFRDKAATPSLMLHAMKMVRDGITHLNSWHRPVITIDQPLFAICKQLQWTYPVCRG